MSFFANTSRSNSALTGVEMPPEVLPQLCRVVTRPFYFEDSQVVLEASHNTISPRFPPNLLLSPYTQVDGEKYKIHRYFLTRESEFFKDMFSLPQPVESTSSPVEGSDDSPIKVPETPTVEFENLLRFFYFGYGTYC
jgi:BTB/POZ domain-containing protein